MNSEKKYVSSSDKVEIILKSLCKESPLSLSNLADLLVKMFGMRFSTARSSVNRIVNDLITHDILEEAGTDRRGSKLIEISALGVYMVVSALSTTKTKYLTIEDLIRFLNKKCREAADILRVYLLLKGEEEHEEYDFLDTILLVSEFEDVDINDWSDLVDNLLELCISEIEEFIDKRGGVLDLREIMMQLPEDLVKPFKKILYAYKDYIDDEIMKYEARKRKIDELLSELERSA